MKRVTTITVNVWHVQENAKLIEAGETDPLKLKPVFCLNTYAGVRWVNGKRVWGTKLERTRHMHSLSLIPDSNSAEYDPFNKTPCGASAWIEYWH